MNDFTKDELSELLDCVSMEGSEILADKIESMIKNFCEHEFGLVGVGENTFAQCMKCGEITRI